MNWLVTGCSLRFSLGQRLHKIRPGSLSLSIARSFVKSDHPSESTCSRRPMGSQSPHSSFLAKTGLPRNVDPVLAVVVIETNDLGLIDQILPADPFILKAFLGQSDLIDLFVQF
jgi:hypothetical protein